MSDCKQEMFPCGCVMIRNGWGAVIGGTICGKHIKEGVVDERIDLAIGQLQTRIAELKKDLAAEKERNAKYQNRCLEATGTNIGAGGMTLLAAIEAAVRPTPDFPAFKTLTKQAMRQELLPRHDKFWSWIGYIFGLEKQQATELCRAMNRCEECGATLDGGAYDAEVCPVCYNDIILEPDTGAPLDQKAQAMGKLKLSSEISILAFCAQPGEDAARLYEWCRKAKELEKGQYPTSDFPYTFRGLFTRVTCLPLTPAECDHEGIMVERIARLLDFNEDQAIEIFRALNRNPEADMPTEPTNGPSSDPTSVKP